MIVGKSMPRVDAHDKAAGRTKYTDDLCDRRALIAKIVHADIAHAYVKAIDTSEAEKVPGVVKIVTCFEVPKNSFPTSGHPWSMDPAHQDVQDRHLLTRHVRYYGDDVAAVVAEDEVAADRAARLVKIEYEELPVVLDPLEAMKDGAPLLHKKFSNNVLNHTDLRMGNYEEAVKEPGLIKVEGWYETPTVQHCHIENAVCFAYRENEKLVVVSSTQIPHIVRRIVGQAIGIPWGSIRVIKPYIGGGFGNKQDVLYEPLCAYLSMQVGGRLVKLDCTREETFRNTRVRHAIKSHIISYVRPDGTLVARKLEAFSNQGAYASHGHAIAAKGMGAFPKLYPCPNVECDSYTVFTNIQPGGAMRSYGMAQAGFAISSHADDIAAALGMDLLEFNRKTLMPKGYVDGFFGTELYADSFQQCLDKGAAWIHYDEKRKAYEKQTGNIRRGIGVAPLWYNTGVYPISLETSSCRMIVNQDGSIQVQVGETEIGQGADTAYTQMTAETVGVPFEMVHVVSCQDTDVTPFGLGAYASRQTYAAGMAIRNTAEELKEKILETACRYTRMQPYLLDIENGEIIRSTDGRGLMSLGELAMTALYDTSHSVQITAEKTTQIRSNAYSFGVCFAEVKVDIEMCRVRLLNIINVHDCGKLINPALAAAQVHGGMSMGIGYALSEKMLYDEKTGKLLNGNLLDYKLSTFMDHPHLEAQFVENPEPTSAYGTKALGEPPVIPVAPAIRAAIRQATGVQLYALPMDPHELYRRFSEEGLI